MPANHYDDLVVLDGLPTNASGSYLGWGIDVANTDTATLGPRIQPLNISPAAGVGGLGIAAPLGSLMLRYDAGNVSLWQKTGAADTAWSPAGTDSRELTDPGNAGAIPIGSGGVVMLVTGAAETRTVADPLAVGLFLTLFFLTDGGDCVVTFASPINTAGNTISTLNDARDSITLVSVRDGAAAFTWALVANNGTALS